MEIKPHIHEKKTNNNMMNINKFHNYFRKKNKKILRSTCINNEFHKWKEKKKLLIKNTTRNGDHISEIWEKKTWPNKYGY